MATFTKQLLSGSTDGKGILVTATSIGSGTTIHTAHATSKDYITLYAHNSDTATIELQIGFGGTTDPDNVIRISIPSKAGLTLVLEKLPLTNSDVVKAAAGTGSKIIIYGDVNRVG